RAAAVAPAEAPRGEHRLRRAVRRRDALRRRVLAPHAGGGAEPADGAPPRPRRRARGGWHLDLALHPSARGSPAPAAARSRQSGAVMSAAPEQPVATSGHEHRDVSPATGGRWMIGIFVLLVVSAAAMWLLLGRYDRNLAAESPPASPLAGYGPQEPPEPRLQVGPARHLAPGRGGGGR